MKKITLEYNNRRLIVEIYPGKKMTFLVSGEGEHGTFTLPWFQAIKLVEAIKEITAEL
jgi:hypothetical protein